MRPVQTATAIAVVAETEKKKKKKNLLPSIAVNFSACFIQEPLYQ